MTSNENKMIFQCSGCQESLNFESKTFPCLHSFCTSCLDRYFPGQTTGKGHCPECSEPLTLDELRLSKILLKSMRRTQLLQRCDDWKCELCFEDGVQSKAQDWCDECQKLLCVNCSRIHYKLHPGHNSKELTEIEQDNIIEAMTEDMCLLHEKLQESYCKQCNVCYCDCCYEIHLSKSPLPGCSSQHPLSVREEAKRQKLRASNLDKEIESLEKELKVVNQNCRVYMQTLNSEFEFECQKLWLDMEEMMETAKHKTRELCEEMRYLTKEQLEKWRVLIEENEKILKQLEIWRLNLHHLLSEDFQDGDIVCGINLLGSKLSYKLQKCIEKPEKCQLEVTVPNCWSQIVERVKNIEDIGSVSLVKGSLEFADEFCLSKINLREINSIYVSDEDNHFFLADWTKGSIIEFSEDGKFITKCNLSDEETTDRFFFFPRSRFFQPWEICKVTGNSIAVLGSYRVSRDLYENRIFVLERKKHPPFLKIKKNLKLQNGPFCSFCKIKENFYVCEFNRGIHSFMENGDKIKSLKPECFGVRIRADPSNDHFWGIKRILTSELGLIHIDSQNGKEIDCIKIENEKVISDFCLRNSFFYLCNKTGIFSPEKILYKFQKESDDYPKFFVLKNKIFLYAKFNNKPKIIVLKIN